MSIVCTYGGPKSSATRTLLRNSSMWSSFLPSGTFTAISTRVLPRALSATRGEVMRTRNGSLPVLTSISSPVSSSPLALRATARLRHVAEVEVERERRLALGHHLLAVEVALDCGDVARGDGLDVLDPAEEVVGERDDAQLRLVCLDRVLQRRERSGGVGLHGLLLGRIEDFRHDQVLLHNGLGARIGIDDFDPRAVVGRAEEAVDHHR